MYENPDTPVPRLGVYTIGQTPRPDLTEILGPRRGTLALEIVGALDGLPKMEVPTCPPGGYPLETLMRDGTRVVVDALFLAPRLQDAITRLDSGVVGHLILCAGSFPGLTAHAPIVQPFDVARREFEGRGFGSLEVLVPFAAQAPPAARKWEEAGFTCRMHRLDERREPTSVADWVSDQVTGTDADALVFDYVGFPAATLDEVAIQIDLPVFDLGHLAVAALERILPDVMRPNQ